MTNSVEIQFFVSEFPCIRIHFRLSRASPNDNSRLSPGGRGIKLKRSAIAAVSASFTGPSSVAISVAQLGHYLGPYRLSSIVGAGRACQVWEAVHEGDSRRVALKVLVPQHSHDSQQLNLMRHEFEVGRGFDHPRVIRTMEFDTSRQAPYLVLEFFGPQNLKQLILQGVDQIAYLAPKIIEQAADGLAYFHRQGWIHRDIKPNNFLTNAEGDVKLIDFALAERRKGFLGRLFGGGSKIQGTRSYISPEQIRRQALDQRSDIYSFGCMAHEIIAGKAPFTGNTDNELLTKHLKSGPPPLEGINSNVRPEFSKLVRQMLAKEPAERPESMDEVLHAVKSMRVFRTNPAPPKAESGGRKGEG